MKRRGQKRFFSLIFVPDRERDPKSISLSYSWGLVFGVILLLFCSHLLFGIFGYIQWYKSKQAIRNLLYENNALKSQNAKIEKIYREFLEIKAMDERIRKAFGSTLGLPEKDNGLTDYKSMQSRTGETIPAIKQSDAEAGSSAPIYKQGLYKLVRTKGDFINPGYLPTQLPVDGYITSHFQKGGWFLGRRHYGIDIAAELGTPIKAAGAGVVILADWTPDFGNIVILAHGQGLFSYYGHASRLLVEQGHFVQRGKTIALLGNSGISSAPHLHFEIWSQEEPLDPELYLFAVQHKR